MGCIVISTATLNIYFNDLLNKIYNALTWTLRNSMKRELEFIEQTIGKVIFNLIFNYF